MKKIIAILLSCILGITLLVGCGSNQKKLDNQKDELIQQLKGENGDVKEIKEGDIYNELEGIAQGSKAFLIQNKDNGSQSILVELNIKEDNKEQSIKDFVDKSAKISSDLEKALTDMEYKNLTILMYVDGIFVGNSISFNVKNNCLEHKDTQITKDYLDAFQKAKNNK